MGARKQEADSGTPKIKVITKGWVSRLKNRHGWTQLDVAERIGMSNRALVQAIQPKTRDIIPWRSLKKLAELADVTEAEWGEFELEWFRWKMDRPARDTDLTGGLFRLLEKRMSRAELRDIVREVNRGEEQGLTARRFPR